LHVAPLRQRKDDILLFSKFFLDKANDELGKDIEGFSDNVKDVFLKYSWPGNLREMKNVIKRAVLLTRSGLVQTNALPSEILSQPDKQSTEEPQDEGLKALTGKTEKELIMATLEKVKYNKSKAAQMLNIDRKTLYNKLKQYDINLD
jgi:two-component system, NtrC family, response regulator HydG